MADANRLAQMVIGGVREEISLDRLMHSARGDITREMRKATTDGVDEQETAVRLQRVFTSKKMYVNRLKNEAGTPSKVAEECYSKCVDMSDIQKQYQKTETVTNTNTAQLDYGLEESKTVSIEQAKRIVQKAKNWNYASGEQADTNNLPACKYEAKCRDHGTYHRAKYSHPESGDLSTRPKHETKSNDHTTRRRDDDSDSRNNSVLTPCKYDAKCHDHGTYHRAKYSHPESGDLSTRHKNETKSDDHSTRRRDNDSDSRNNSALTPCKYEAKCHDHSDYHQAKYSHPKNDEHRMPCKYGLKCHDRNDYHQAKYSHPNTSS
jgi:hypothetical protein